MLALAAALLLQQAPLEDLLRGLRDDAPAAREAAFRGLVEGWERWSGAELAALRAAGEDADPDVAGRAKAAALRIEIRRRVGPPAPGLLEDVDVRLPVATPAARLALLKSAGELVEQSRLDPRVLEGLVSLTVERGWPLPAPELVELVAQKRDSRDAKPWLPLIARLLDPRGPQTPATAAVALLGRHGAVEHYAAVLPLLSDPEGRWASVCVDVLGDPAARALAPRVAESMARAERAVRLPAAEILGRMGAHEHASALASRLGPGTDSDELRVLLGALGLMAASEHADAVGSFLEHEDRDVRIAAATAAGRLGAVSLVPRLAARLKDPQNEVRQTAVDAIVMLQFRTAVPALVPLLGDRDAVTRGLAAQALGSLDAASEARSIADVLSHDHPWSRAQALRALGRLGAAETAPDLERLLDDEWNVVREAAALGLAELPSVGDSALAALRALQLDPSEDVREAALVALARHAGADALAAADSFDPATVEVLADVLAAKHEAEGRARLRKRIELDRAVDSKERLVAVLAAAGFSVEGARELGFVGRIPSGLRVAPRDLVARAWPGLLPVPDGKRLLLLTPPSAVAHWRTRLATR